MRLNCGGESTRGCREESMLTKGLSAKGESKWVHIHVGNTKTAEGQIKLKKRLNISGSQLVQIHKLISELILHLQKNRCACPNDRRPVAGKKMFHPYYWLNSLTAKSVPAGTKNSHSEGFLLEKHLKHTAHNHHHHDAAVCPSSGMVLMEEHTPPPGASLQGVGRGRRRRVLSESIK